jgi:nucleotide-binding universal stress UspA family protein
VFTKGASAGAARFSPNRLLEDLFVAKNNILVPVDFSPDSLAAVDQGLILCKALEADMVLLHVVHDPTDNPGFYHKKKGKKLIQLMGENAEELMADFIKEQEIGKKAKNAGVELMTRLVRGIPSAQIVKAAAKENSSMIVIGSSGRTGLAHLLVGSVTERVVENATAPVMVVKTAKKK